MKVDDLKQPFSKALFFEINNQLIDAELTPSQLSVSLENSKFITNTKYYGNYEDLDLHILTIEHSGTEDTRVGVSLDIFKLMKKYSLQNALVAACSKTSDSWRYSLVTSNLSVNDQGKVTKEFSNPRRYSFVLGPNQKVLTPYKQLIQYAKVPDINELSKRFSLEVVNNEFYKEIAKLYDDLVGTEKVVRKLKYPNQGDESHEFAVRLIGRIIFCWFLREKKSKVGMSLVPSTVISRAASNESSYYHKILAPLFFEVLNKPIIKRTDKFKTGEFADIPYLNGGLFNDDDIDYYTFDKSLELSVPGLVEIPNSWLHELFDLLERFNFTVDENTSYDTDLSIDPEMLGRVFENLLARINPETGETVRKSTGSFYTPREIVEYMVDASLSEYLVSKTGLGRSKIDALVSYDLFDDLENNLDNEESVSVLEALSTLTVLDPACGSGAFPIGMLQKIVFIITKLDPKADWWLAKQLEGASPELRREFTNRSVDYIRKLGIIRQTIFGVDIQPIATEISRLRCFLTLIVDEAVDDTQENRGIRPLPNLDFKFVTANSLIALPKPEDKGGNISDMQAAMFEETSHIDELKQIRNEYFSSTNHERNELQSQFDRLQKKMVLTNVDVFHGSASKLYDTLSRWEPFEHKPSTWFDPSWMFGVEHFDIVIANPPYIRVDKIEAKQKVKYKEIYKTVSGKYDLYYLFYEQAYLVVKDGGVVTFITPNKFCAADSGETLRQLLIKNNSLEIVSTSKLGVFDGASNYPVIVQLVKNTNHPTFNFREASNILSLKDTTKNHYQIGKDNLDLLPAKVIPINCTKQELDMVLRLIKCNSSLGKSIQFSEGLRINTSYELTEKSDHHIVKQYQFGKWTKVNKGSYIDDADLQKVANKNSSRYTKIMTDKIIIAEDALEISATIDEDNCIPQGGIYFGSASNNYAMLGILNSNLLSTLYEILFGGMHMGGGYLRYRKKFLEVLPIPATALKNEDLSISAKKIINAKKTGGDSIELELHLNQLVYKLYNLTPEEIAITERAN